MKTKTLQQINLFRLLDIAGDTEFGRKYGFDSIKEYPVFADKVPIHFYRDLLPYIEKMKEGREDVLWPGKVDKFAVSAGTTGEGKHLPLTSDRLGSDSAYMKELAFSYLRQRPNPFRLIGKHLSLPGSVEQHGAIQIGEVSGFSALSSPAWLRPFQLADPVSLTAMNFREKFDLMLQKALTANVKVITAVPSWILTLFQQALKKTGSKSIEEIWPSLKLLVCGGVKLSNYRPHLNSLMGNLNPDFIETYGASEGYLAFSDDLQKEDLKLVTDNGIFFEFIKDPLPEKDALAIQDAVPIWQVEKNVPYAVIVSTNAGLWRYALRDVIEFTSTEPPRIIVKGRINEMLDDFGEGLYIYEADDALSEALNEMELQRGTFTIIPRLPSESEVPFHHWLIQFSKPIHPDTLRRLADKIDEKLKTVNRHYAIRRESGTLAKPRIGSISQQDVNRWLDACDKVRAQGKLPKILRENEDLLL
ncbi:MAG: GH3 auxin-responsive promoter family protein [Balneolaceae bacterium]|nr:GH3 auxin-responsive promoter family protein [Balneolaceae bacterium]